MEISRISGSDIIPQGISHEIRSVQDVPREESAERPHEAPREPEKGTKIDSYA